MAKAQAIPQLIAEFAEKLAKCEPMKSKAPGSGFAPPAEPEEPRLRFSPTRFLTLREKLGLSAADMGKLMGVSGQSVYKWESGTLCVACG
jgi:hypothetical protein